MFILWEWLPTFSYSGASRAFTGKILGQLGAKAKTEWIAFVSRVIDHHESRHLPIASYGTGALIHYFSWLLCEVFLSPVSKGRKLGSGRNTSRALVSFILVFLSCHPSPVTSTTSQVSSFPPLLRGSPPSCQSSKPLRAQRAMLAGKKRHFLKLTPTLWVGSRLGLLTWSLLFFFWLGGDFLKASVFLLFIQSWVSI